MSVVESVVRFLFFSENPSLVLSSNISGNLCVQQSFDLCAMGKAYH